MPNEGYSVALRVWHPRRDPSEIAQSLALVPTYTHAAGMPRTTPRGSPLAGEYRESYCTFHIRIEPDLQTTLRALGEFIERESALVRTWISEGGRVSCSVSASGEHEPVLLTSELFRICAHSAVRLDIMSYAVLQKHDHCHGNRLASR